MEHTFLLQSGVWIASGSYYDEEENRFPFTGESRISRENGDWTIGGLPTAGTVLQQLSDSRRTDPAGDRMGVAQSIAWTIHRPVPLRGGYDFLRKWLG